MISITPNDFSKLIIDNIDKYSKDVLNVVKTETDFEINEAKKEVVAYSQPKPGHLLKSGDYKKGWGVSTLRKGGVYKRKLYNKKKPTLVHLLEYGHSGPVGVPKGETRSPAYPHVSKTEIKHSLILYEKIKRGIESL